MDRIAALLESRYGLDVERLATAPRGWTGETYVATARGGARYFVKVYPKDRLPRTTIPALQALTELHRLGVTQVSRPVLTADGSPCEWLGPGLLVVFEYLDAAPVPFAFGGEELGDLIARVHEQTPRVASPLERETFAVRYADDLSRILDRARREPASDEPRRRLRRFLDERGSAIAEEWATFGEVARACRAARFELVLTHGDWPFNLLRTADGTVYLIDWDELLLAPAERDTWLADGDPAFARGYRARHRGQADDPLATAFYVYHRYFEELYEFAGAILGDGTPERRATALALIDGDWMSGLRARMRRGRIP